MTISLDAQLSSAVATWLATTFNIDAISIRDLGFRDAQDAPMFAAAKAAGAVFMTKDADFVELVERLGPPPQVVWLRCGNTSNAALRRLLSAEWPQTMARLATGEALVEIGAEDNG